VSDQNGGTDFWITDSTTPGDGYRYAVSRILTSKRTHFQDLAIVESRSFGKALLLDGNWQSCVADEFLYHEPLVQPAMLLHGSPRSVAILGGGEGATLREVLRWRSVERVTMVDLDAEVVEACKEHLEEMHQGAFDDPRVELVIGDARDWLDSTTDTYDVLISDVSEPLEDGPAFQLFTKEYFQRVRRVLAPDGFFSVQAGCAAPHDMRVFARVANTVAGVFEHTRPYVSQVPSFATPWGFLLASSRPLDSLPPPERIDDLLTQKTTGRLRMLDGEALWGLFLCSVYVRRALAEEKEVYTLGDPPRRKPGGTG
jgi:spermidine synthase